MSQLSITTSHWLFRNPTFSFGIAKPFASLSTRGFSSMNDSRFHSPTHSSIQSTLGVQTMSIKKNESSLKDLDPEVYDLIRKEQIRQNECMSLIASENICPEHVSEVLSSCLINKYSEGTPGDRYYAGNNVIDEIETLCQHRALEAFGLDSSNWGVNVQCLSGSPANFEVYCALLNPNDRIMYLELSHGGHLSHGHKTPTRNITATSKFFNTLPYRVNAETGLIDYDELELLAERFRPHLLICGYSSYTAPLDYQRFRSIANRFNTILMCDMAHIAGLIAANLLESPFRYCDIVTTTTHKTLRGPRGAMIFYRKGLKSKDSNTSYDYERKINSGVFPGCQGGPHNHTIGAIATALKTVCTPEFHQYQSQIIANATALTQQLISKGYCLLTNGTCNHMLVIDFSKEAGFHVEVLVKLLEDVNIVVNKNAVPGDKNARVPHGIRLGVPAITSRGFRENHMQDVADFFHQTVQLYNQKIVSNDQPCNTIEDYCKRLQSDPELLTEIEAIRNKVKTYLARFVD